MTVVEPKPIASGNRSRQPALAQRVLIFHLASEAYCIPLDAVQEIVPLPLLFCPPALPSVLAGFLNLGGTAIPVVRLARMFGLPEQEPGLFTPLLVLHGADRPLALLVDAVNGIASVDQSDLVRIQETFCFNDCAEGLVTIGESHMILLSEQRILREEEQRRIADLAAIEQSRLAELQEAQP